MSFFLILQMKELLLIRKERKSFQANKVYIIQFFIITVIISKVWLNSEPSLWIRKPMSPCCTCMTQCNM